MISNQTPQVHHHPIVMAPRPIIASFGLNAWDTRLTRETLHWTGLVKRLSTAVQTGIGHHKFMTMPKQYRQDLKRNDPYVVFGSFKDNKRNAPSLESRSALMLDFDENTAELYVALMAKTLHLPFAYLWYTTHSHTPGKPRLRIVVPLSRDVAAAEYRLLIAVVAELFPAAGLDDGSLEPARIMYLPVRNIGAEFECDVHVGDGYLNPDCYLANVDPKVLKRVATRPALAVMDKDFSALEMKHPDPRWTIERVKNELLPYIDLNDDVWDRERWRNLGMLLHHQGDGDDEWFELWEELSSRDGRVDKDGNPMYQPELCEKLWEGFGRLNNVVAIGTLVLWVKEEKAARLTALGQMELDDEPVPMQKSSTERFKLRSAAELANLPPLKWMVFGMLPRDGAAALFGPPGCGKSFLALAIAAAVAGGAPDWSGRRVTQCPVVYCVLEGEAGIGKRLKAWTQHHEKPLPDDLRFVTASFDLRKNADLIELAQAIRDAGGAGGLVVLDTLNRAAPGADENSSVDMGLIIAATKKLQEWLGGLVLLVHHTGKDATKGLRGHSSLLAALDAAIEVTDRREWVIAKSKDDESGGVHAFALHVVALGTDEYGDPITSCVVESDSTMQAVRRPNPQGPKQLLVHNALKQLLCESMDCGEEGAPENRPCVALEAAMTAASATLIGEDPKRRRTIAKRAIEGMASRRMYQIKNGWLWAV